jgi:hypothetical protein
MNNKQLYDQLEKSNLSILELQVNNDKLKENIVKYESVISTYKIDIKNYKEKLKTISMSNNNCIVKQIEGLNKEIKEINTNYDKKMLRIENDKTELINKYESK